MKATVGFVPRLVLASTSPRRRHLLSEAGYEFDMDSPDVDETRQPREVALDYVVRLSKEKALSVSQVGSVSLGADTIVVQNGVVLGKPATADEAAAMLHSLSESIHHVLTGWTLAGAGAVLKWGVEVTEVEFRSLLPLEIARYVASGEPMDRAGSYAIQGGARGFVTRFSGPFDNVVGLPMAPIGLALAALGVSPGCHP